MAFAVRSAILHAAPSRTKRASSAASKPSVVIGITVVVTSFVVGIGAICWLLWRRWRKVKKTRYTKVYEADTIYVGHESIHDLRISELPDTSILSEAGVATLPRYSESLQRPHPASLRAIPCEPTTTARPDSSINEKYNSLDRIHGIKSISPLGQSPINEGKF